MENKILKAEIRGERAVRRIAASIGYVIAAVLLIMVLTQYLKFDPKTGEDITDGKLKQFLKVYENKALIEAAAFSVLASLTCFLPAFLADISTFAVSAASLFIIYQKTLGNITKFPNGFFAMAVCFFGASLYCAVMRSKIYNTKGRRFNLNPLIPLSAFLMLADAFICKKIVDFKYEYEIYNRLVDVTADDYVEKDWGVFEPLLQKIDLCVDSDYISISIVLTFAALIVLVLHNFPRLATLSAGTAAFYTLYKMTVGNIKVASVPIFLVSVFALAAAIAAVSASGHLKDESEYAPEELEEEVDEDDEDELEYLKNKNELEKNGLEMQDFDC